MEWKTTFYSDFTIADHFGLNAVKDTYNRAFNEWKSNTEYVTELSMTLNHKIWEHYYKEQEETAPQKKEYEDKLARLYDKLWREIDYWCIKNLKGNDLNYYYQITD